MSLKSKLIIALLPGLLTPSSISLQNVVAQEFKSSNTSIVRAYNQDSNQKKTFWNTLNKLPWKDDLKPKEWQLDLLYNNNGSLYHKVGEGDFFQVNGKVGRFGLGFSTGEVRRTFNTFGRNSLSTENTRAHKIEAGYSPLVLRIYDKEGTAWEESEFQFYAGRQFGSINVPENVVNSTERNINTNYVGTRFSGRFFQYIHRLPLVFD